MQLALMMLMVLLLGVGLVFVWRSLEFRELRPLMPLPVLPRVRNITGCLVGFTLFCGAWVGFVACASARPILQDARDEFVKACSALTAATLTDAQPSKIERIASKVCLAEKMGETIEHEVVSDGEGLGLFTEQQTFSDAGTR